MGWSWVSRFDLFFTWRWVDCSASTLERPQCVSQHLSRHASPPQVRQWSEIYLQLRGKQSPPLICVCTSTNHQPQTSVDFSIAIIGYLLYGDAVLDELSTNMIKEPGYPKPLKVAVLVLIAIVPLTKFSLLYVRALYHTFLSKTKPSRQIHASILISLIVSVT